MTDAGRNVELNMYVETELRMQLDEKIFFAKKNYLVML